MDCGSFSVLTIIKNDSNESFLASVEEKVLHNNDCFSLMSSDGSSVAFLSADF